MASWNAMRNRITASVRTTNRMNALLSDSLLSKRRTVIKLTPSTAAGDGSGSGAGGDKDALRNELKYFATNFSMERVYKLIESIVEDRLTWDRFCRTYNPWRSLQMAESLAVEIRDAIKRLNYRRHRIVCILSIIEKQNQGIHIRMRHMMNEKMDNFTKFVYERPTYFIVITLYLVFKD